MKVGFSVDENDQVSVNALTDAAKLEGVVDITDDEKAIAVLDFTDRKSQHRGDLGPAFAAIRLLIEVNHFHNGSLCYAVEEMLEEAFDAGRKYELGRLQLMCSIE